MPQEYVMRLTALKNRSYSHKKILLSGKEIYLIQVPNSIENK